MFSSATESRLVSRLKQICSLEKLGNVASSSLSALAQACGGDIRSAINTLQFASMRAKEIIGTSHSDKLNLKHADTASLQSTLGALLTTGLKDERQDVFRLWSQIFSFKEAAARFTKKFHMIAGGGGVAESSTGGAEGSARASHAMKVLDAVYAYNDHQLVISGVQENYLSIRYTDPSLLKTCSAADWISTANILEGNVYVIYIHYSLLFKLCCAGERPVRTSLICTSQQPLQSSTCSVHPTLVRTLVFSTPRKMPPATLTCASGAMFSTSSMRGGASARLALLQKWYVVRYEILMASVGNEIKKLKYE